MTLIAETGALAMASVLNVLLLNTVLITGPPSSHLLFYAAFPPTLFLLFKSALPSFAARFRDLFVTALYVSCTLHQDAIFRKVLENSPERAPLLTALMGLPALPCAYLGSFVPISNPFLHLSALILSYSLWSHKHLYATTPAAQAKALIMGVLFPVALNSGLRFRAAGSRLPAALKGLLGEGKQEEDLYEPIFSSPPSSAPSSLLGPPCAAPYKLAGPAHVGQITPVVLASLRLSLEKDLSARMGAGGSAVVVALDVREGCILIRVGCVSRAVGGGWRRAAEDLPTSAELQSLLPDSLRCLVKQIASPVDPEDPFPKLAVWLCGPPIPLPPPLSARPRSRGAPFVPITLTLGVSWADGAASAGLSLAEGLAAMEPVCWIDSQAPKLQIQGQPSWDFGRNASDAGGAAPAAHVTFTVLVDPCAAGCIEPGLSASHLIVGLEPMGNGAVSDTAEGSDISISGSSDKIRPGSGPPPSPCQCPTLIAVPLLPRPVLAELATLRDASRRGLLSDIAQLLDLRSQIAPGDALSDPVTEASAHVRRFALRKGLQATLLLAEALGGGPRRTAPQVVQAPRLSYTVALAELARRCASFGAFSDRNLELKYQHMSVKAARRRHANVVFVRLFFMCLGPLFGVVPFGKIPWGVLVGSSVFELAATQGLYWAERWMHGKVPLLVLKLLSIAQAFFFFLGNCPWPFEHFCAHAARTSSPPSARLFWLKNTVPEALLLTASSAGPWAAVLSCTLVTLRMHAFYSYVPECRALEPEGGMSPAQIRTAALAAMGLASLATGAALDRYRRSKFLAGHRKEQADKGSDMDGSEDMAEDAGVSGPARAR